MTADSTPVAKPQAGLYKISRASGGYYPAAPCEGAFLLRVVSTDKRSGDIGHRDEWFVLIPDLMAFADKHGPIIVQRDDDGFPAVTIYDSCVE